MSHDSSWDARPWTRGDRIESINQSRRDISRARRLATSRSVRLYFFLARASTSQRARGLARATGRTTQSSSQSKARHSFAEGFSAHRASSGSRARILAPRLARAKFCSRVAASSKANRAPGRSASMAFQSSSDFAARIRLLVSPLRASQEAARARPDRGGGRAVGRFVNAGAGARARGMSSVGVCGWIFRRLRLRGGWSVAVTRRRVGRRDRRRSSGWTRERRER